MMFHGYETWYAKLQAELKRIPVELREAIMNEEIVCPNRYGMPPNIKMALHGRQEELVWPSVLAKMYWEAFEK